MSDSLQPSGLQPTRLLCPWDSPAENTRVGSHSLYQGIFPTYGSNPCLLQCRQILCHLSYQRSQIIKEEKANIVILLIADCCDNISWIICWNKIQISLHLFYLKEKVFIYIFEKSINYLWIDYINKLKTLHESDKNTNKGRLLPI